MDALPNGDEAHARAAAHSFVEQNGWWKGDVEAMLTFSDLRDMIVHERYPPYEYLSIPSGRVLEEIDAIRARLLRPTRSWTPSSSPSMGDARRRRWGARRGGTWWNGLVGPLMGDRSGPRARRTFPATLDPWPQGGFP